MRTDLQQRFEASFIPEPMSGCWLWEQVVGIRGYGKMKVDGKMIGAHRASYMIYKGALDSGLSVLHSCDNAICVNPEHLHLGSHIQNMNEGVERGRFNRWKGRRRGDANPNAKMNLQKVSAMRMRHALGESAESLASEFGISPWTAKDILAQRTWSSDALVLTKAQTTILRLMVEKNGDLVNFDEVSPQWWVEGGLGLNNRAAKRLAKTKAVEFYRHEGGQPGVLYFRITDAGRLALKNQESDRG